MRDVNQVHAWPQNPFPAGASLWPKMTGRLTGHGQSHYSCTPDYFCPHVVVKGLGWVRSAQGERKVGPGDMFTLWPGEAIEYFEDPRRPWTYYWIHLHGPGAPGFMRALGFLPDRPCFRPHDPTRVSRLFKAIHEACGRRRSGEAAAILARLYELIPVCMTGEETSKDTGAHEALATRATAMLESLLHTGPNINELAAMLGVSRATLFRSFRERLSQTPVKHLASLRLRKAKELLESTAQPIASIARAAGFRNEKYFHRCFHRAEGKTPSAWRNSLPISRGRR